MNVKIYIEGGGDNNKLLQIQCRTGFRQLIEKAGFIGRMPATVACGGRESAFNDFKTAVVNSKEDEYVILLVDSEEPISSSDVMPDSNYAWDHLLTRDKWERPHGVSADQAQLMVTCMETWIMADRKAMSDIFGAQLQMSALLPENNLEIRPRHEVQDKLAHATRDCGKDRTYTKGKRSFMIIGKLNPETLKAHLPYFRRFIETLEQHL